MEYGASVENFPEPPIVHAPVFEPFPMDRRMHPHVDPEQDMLLNLSNAESEPRPVPHVLYIDDEGANRQVFQATFRKEFHVDTAASLAEAWPLLKDGRVDVVICDQRMPGVEGCEALKRIRERYPRVRRMLITAHADLQALVDALNEAGVCHYIQKPWAVAEVRDAVNKAFAELQVEAERTALTERLMESNRQLEFALRQRLLS